MPRGSVLNRLLLFINRPQSHCRFQSDSSNSNLRKWYFITFISSEFNKENSESGCWKTCSHSGNSRLEYLYYIVIPHWVERSIFLIFSKSLIVLPTNLVMRFLDQYNTYLIFGMEKNIIQKIRYLHTRHKYILTVFAKNGRKNIDLAIIQKIFGHHLTLIQNQSV